MRWCIFILFSLLGCGGGGNAPPPPTHTEILVWNQPALFNDNTPMDLRRDVARWDIYCSTFPSFIDNDLAASVVMPDNLTFNLSLLRIHGIELGDEGKFISIKCIGVDNQASDYSEPALWAN